MSRKRWWVLVVPVAVALPIAATVSQGAEDGITVYDLQEGALPDGAVRTIGERSATEAAASLPDAPVTAELRRDDSDTFLVLSGPSDALEGFVGDEIFNSETESGTEAAPTPTGPGSFAVLLPPTANGDARVVLASDEAVAARVGGDGAATGEIVAVDEIGPLSGRGQLTIVSYALPAVAGQAEGAVVVASFAHAPIRPDVAAGLGGDVTSVAGRPGVVYERPDGGAFATWSPDDAHVLVLDCSTCTGESVKSLAAQVEAIEEGPIE